MAEQIIDMIEGEFTHTIYRSDSYMVSRFQTAEGLITVTGPSFDYEKGQKYVLTGSYVDHPRYGFQFSMLTIEKYLPSQKEEILSFLKGKTFPGIGKKAAEKIYEHFGSETLSILKEDPSRILELDLTNKQLASLQEGFEKMNDPENEILFHLVSNGFNNNDAQRIFARFKLATKEVGEDNPFRFYSEVYGISFDKVKRYAEKIEFDDPQNKYREAYLIYLLTDMTFNSGDMYVEKKDLKLYLDRIGGMDNLEEILERCADKRYLYLDEDRVYLYSDYMDEKFIADFMGSYQRDMHLEEEYIAEGIENNEHENSIEYDEKQKEAISSFFRNDLSIIVGGPGTGKTTIVKAMADIFKTYFPYNNLMVVAPTGRAAKRINEICDVESKTIHSLLRWDKESNLFAFDIDNPLLYDAIIIDEFSMVDNSLFAALLKACKRVQKICIIGDDNQLPSIRPGNLLQDLIASERFPVIKLDLNYRQNKGNEIITLANDIIDGDVDLKRYQDDVCFYEPMRNDFDLISLIKEDMKEGYTLDDIQILAPMYKGEWGIDNLNLLLQNTFNPASFDKKERKSGKYIFREGDKILQLKNRPTEDVYNGDIGIMEDIDLKEKEMMVNYGGVYVFYDLDDLSDISLAYALSVHKSQGSEYPIVYFVFNRNNYHMLNRNLIYTAITRAKKKLVIIGDRGLMAEGLKRSLRKRKTGLLRRFSYDS